MYNWMITRGVLQQNPFAEIKQLKVDKFSGFNPWTKAEFHRLKNRLQSQEPELWLYICIIYYCFIRPVEIRRLKISNVWLDRDRIIIPGQASKNDITSSVIVPNQLKNLLIKQIGTKTGKCFLFGKDFKPAMKPISKSKIDRLWTKIVKKELKIEKQPYALKHNGNIELIMSGVDLQTIQLQNRHHSIAQTQAYFKKMIATNILYRYMKI